MKNIDIWSMQSKIPNNSLATWVKEYLFAINKIEWIIHINPCSGLN